ncbi:MAG: three-Cys-motif partner protein TcmP [Zoogloeaceae bacterium]|jgi:three-Cys-motif partner protein|nr:three-Cys-motif partner protein TcmP [Zoogloeaceae bacterium]
MNNTHVFGGEWTRTKLEALRKYLAAYTTALKNQNFRLLYIDAFAGTGFCDINGAAGEGEQIKGSATLALEIVPTFDKFFFVDLKKTHTAALRGLKASHPEKNIEVIRSDANAALTAICRQIDRNRERAVIFIDPYGMDVEWKTLQAVAATRATDLWYLFPLSGLYRNAAKSAEALDEGKTRAITRILGTDVWRTEFYRPNPQASLFGETEGDVRDATPQAMLDFVSGRLKTIFPHVSAPTILYLDGSSRTPRGAPLFALYFAVANPSPQARGIAANIANHILGKL